MKVEGYFYNFNALNIKASDIAEFIGYSTGKVPDLFQKMINEVLKKANGICKIRAAARTIDNFSLAENRDGFIVDSLFF